MIAWEANPFSTKTFRRLVQTVLQPAEPAVTILPAIVGTIAISAAFAYAGYWMYIVLRWPSVAATLLRYWKTRGSEGVYYRPVYRFQTQKGATYIAISNWGSWRRPWSRGAALRIRYCPNQPKRTEIQTAGNSLGIFLRVIALGIFFWIGALWKVLPVP